MWKQVKITPSCVKKDFQKTYRFVVNRTTKTKKHYVFIKDFNTFMYNRSLHRGKKYFCGYCLETFSTEEIVKSDVNDCFKINGKQLIQMLKEGEYIKLKNNCKKNKIIISDLCKFWKHFDAKR